MYPRLKPLAATLSLLFASPVFADAALDPIVVTATRQPTRVSELLADVTIIEREEIEQAGNSSLEDLLSRQPGIQMSANGSYGSTSNIFVRGTNGSHVLVLLDGVRQGSATSGNIAWSRLPLNQIDRIEILRGPASSLYGSDAIGGVVQIFTRKGDGPTRFSGEAGFGSNQTWNVNAGVSGSNAGWHYAFQGSDFSTKGINSKPADAAKDHDGYRLKTANARLGYQVASGHELGGTLFRSEGKNDYDNGGDDWSQQDLTSLNLYSKNQITENWLSSFSFAKASDELTNVVATTKKTEFNTKQKQLVWQNDLKTQYGMFLMGVEQLNQEVDTTTQYSQTTRTVDSILLGWTGNFQAHSFQLNARYDDNSQFGEKTTGSANYGYRFTPNWRASLGYGTAFKAPTFNDLYYPLTSTTSKKTGKTTINQGDPNLLPEFSRNQEAALHFERGSRHLSLTWFLNKVEDLIAWQSNTAGSVTTGSPVNVSNARIQGTTLAYEEKFGDYQVTGAYNWLDAHDENTGNWLPRRAKNYGTFALGRNLGSWDWRVELQASGHRYDEASNATRMPGYGLLNLYGAYSFAKDWALFARLNNALDKNYVLVSGYDTPGMNAFFGVRYSPK
jgi:vitamin B12 transporter